MYIAEERETIINTSDADKNWSVYTRQQKIIRKLEKLGYVPSRVELDGEKVVGAEFTIDLGKITFKKAIIEKRVYTDEQKQIMANRLKENLTRKGQE